MNNKPPPSARATREDRLKAALKANLGRRKMQARAKAAPQADKQAGDQAPKKEE